MVFNLLVGILTFRDYGLSWDEPLFYDYANSLVYAYSPVEWFSGSFDLSNAYGASASDHANRGPAYILLAHLPVSLLQVFGVHLAEAWHLVNFLTFQVGVFLFYRLSRRWLKQPAALTSTAFFSWQPLLWGHAFINPKDPPFLVFFLASVHFGFKMVDDLADRKGRPVGRVLIAAIFLGIATSIRVLGPLAGLLTGLYAFSRLSKVPVSRSIKYLALYGGLAAISALILWPYLWTDPIGNFLKAFGFMSDNPTQLRVLFNAELFRADQLPRRYLPVLLGLNLTEPVWIMFALGLMVIMLEVRRIEAVQLILILLWFLTPFAYVLVRKPPMYDGFRHFLFILPPIFLFSGFAFEKLYSWIHAPRWSVVLATGVLLPSILGNIQLHPFQYTYYNSIAGGTGGAFRSFETDYWLTCYKQALEEFQKLAPDPATIYVNREAHIAATYVSQDFKIFDRRGAGSEIQPGDYFLVNTRANEDLRFYREAPVVTQVGRMGAVFCYLKRVE